jgi:hypothetical protein
VISGRWADAFHAAAFEAAGKSGRANDLQRELEELFESQNKSSSKDTTVIAATYLRVTVAVE